MRGILLAGGAGTRLHPVTYAVSKQLLPVFNKPLIYYPLSSLMLARIREVLLISTPGDLPLFKRLLGDGTALGLNVQYAEQARPNGIADAFLIGEHFLAGGAGALALGDNVLYGNGLADLVRWGSAVRDGGRIYAYHVSDPERYGIVEFDESGIVIGLEEKPSVPRSSYAVPGLYFYDDTVVERAKTLTPSGRGELEITDLNCSYLKDGALAVEKLGRGIAWFDTGTHESLLDAANFVAAVENRQGLNLACVEEIAWRSGWITDEQLLRAATAMGPSSYGAYLRQVLHEQL
jgi:glucose-1-phosphate thymidylyltransferase